MLVTFRCYNKPSRCCPTTVTSTTLPLQATAARLLSCCFSPCIQLLLLPLVIAMRVGSTLMCCCVFLQRQPKYKGSC